jgi:hypothetical protein
MKAFRGAIIVVALSVTLTLGQTPSVPKLPHVPTGEMTVHGLDYKVPLPKEGLVPDKETAIKIAEVILFRLMARRMSRRRSHTA